ncbi:MAG: sulfate transporter [Cytophagaceae bacterium]|jgi:MFS superfamily sulfate permease-like transporter|nr:sulfate transporter [Cytophagaceae bacterium]
MTTNVILKDGMEGLKQNWKQDMLSGFLVFLIALPLCLGISLASGFPPISGIFTAIIGGLLVSFLGGANVAIKGPAAGLIVIAIGAVTELGAGSSDPMRGYELALATIVISGIFQTLLGILRAGSLSDFFPTSAVHGMLSSIGIIIFAKQAHVALGVKPDGKGPLELLAEIPHSIATMNPEIAIIGIVSLMILFTLPLVKNRYVKMIPAPMVVVLIAIPLGYYFDLEHAHKYLFLDGQYELGPKFLVTLPNNILDGIHSPNWSAIGTWTTWKYVIMFTLVGSLESVLSSKAVDILDPYKRKTKMNKDLIGVGIGNTISGLIGGLPMISEIVRSSANINNGGKTKWSNFFHGGFLLLFVALLPGLIHQIPLAALAAMLIFTGYRLASPKVFKETLKVGVGQLIVFVFTIIVTLATDLIVGIVAGILMELFIQLFNGAKIKYLFSSHVIVSSKDKNEHVLAVNGVLTFTNYLSLKKKLDQFTTKDRLQLDLSHVEYVDHTVMEHLHHLGEDYHRDGGELKVVGADKLKPMSAHPLSDRSLSKEAVVVEARSTREDQLKSLASQMGFTYKDFHKDIISNFGKLSNEHKVIKYEGNILSKQIDGLSYVISDLSIVSGGDFKAGVSNLTVLSVSNLRFGIPLFAMREERFFDNAFLSDINFADHPKFSKTYKLNGFSEAQVREFFTKNLITYFENQDIYHIESLGSELIIYKHAQVASPQEIKSMMDFAKGLVEVIAKR